jgi:3-hydroxymyristoyl/3-hydroxydecanoyl-(acyl carrier protein) dehydratase
MFEWLESLAIHAAEAKAAAGARIPANHPFLTDHFPGHPLLPGSLQIELCAQVAGPLVEELAARRHGAERFAFLGMVRNAKFHAPVALPATLGIFLRATRVERDSAVVEGHLTHAIDAVDCRVELVMVLRPAEQGWEDAIRVYRTRLAALKARAQP